MSHEILLLAGLPRAEDRAHRRILIAHAAHLVPSRSSHQILETECAAVALVQTEPTGGSSATLQRAGGVVRAALAVTEAGLQTALSTQSPHEHGAEAGHVLVQADADQVSIVTDGLGFVPAYWGQSDGSLVLSTHLASLVSLGLAAEPDEQGVAEYLVHMHPWGHRTLLRGAELLSPGGALRWQVDQPARLTAQPLYTPGAPAMTDDEAVAEFAELWPQVLQQMRERGGTSRTAVALSGGLDSRAIAAGCVGIGWHPMTYTYGSLRNDETRTAVRIAERLQLPQAVIPVDNEHLLRDLPRILDAMDGAHTPGEMYESWFDERLRSFSDVIVNGMIAGPMWGDDRTMGMTDRGTVARQLQSRFAGAVSAATPFVRVESIPDLAFVIRSGIEEALEGWSFDERADMVMFWKQANKMLRWGSMLTNSLRRGGLRLEAPFLNRRFVSFSARLSPAQRMNGNLYLRVHREVFAATADIGRSDDGNSPQTLNHVYWSGERTIGAQMLGLTRQHPIAGLRRGSRRLALVGADQARRRAPVSVLADRLEERRNVFPADLWVRRRPVYAARLADLLQSAVGAGSVLDDDAMLRAADQLRAGTAGAPALALARVGAAGNWLNDYRRRERSRRDAPPATD